LSDLPGAINLIIKDILSFQQQLYLKDILSFQQQLYLLYMFHSMHQFIFHCWMLLY